MGDVRGSRGMAFARRAAVLGVLGGVVFATSGCFLPNTGTLRVDVIEQLDNTAQPFDFDKDTYYVPRGEVDAFYTAPVGSGIPHTLKLRQDGGPAIEGTIDLGMGPGPDGGDADEGTFEVPKGTYELFCDVGPHAALGMTATLIVI